MQQYSLPFLDLVNPITRPEMQALLDDKKPVVAIDIVGTDMIFTLDDGSNITVDVTPFMTDVFMQSASYNPATKNIDVSMSDGTTISIPVTDLLDSVTDDTINGDGNTTPLSVNISSDAGNSITVGSDGGLFSQEQTSLGDMQKSTYDTNNSGVVDNSEKVNGLTVETSVPLGAVFTDTIYDDTALDARVAINDAKISNVAHPLVETAVPVGAVFTDTVYDDTALQNQVTSNTTAISGKADAAHQHTLSDITDFKRNTIAWCFNGAEQVFNNAEVKMLSSSTFGEYANSAEVSILNGDFTINVSGLYKFTYKLNFKDKQDKRENVNTYAKNNGVILPETHCYTYVRNNVDGNGTGTFHGARYFQAGDVVNFWMINNSSNNVALIASDSFMQVEYCPNTDLAVP